MKNYFKALLLGLMATMATSCGFYDIPVDNIQTIPTKIEFKNTSTIMPLNSTQQMNIVYTPSYATVKEVTYLSSNTSCITITSSGLASANAEGTSTITATLVGYETVKCSIDITVSFIHVESVELGFNDGKTLHLGDNLQLNPIFTPAQVTNDHVSYSSSNPSIVSVNASGYVTANAAGTATVTVETDDGNKTDSVNFEVMETTSLDFTYTEFNKAYRYNTPIAPLEGNFNPLIIPVWFTDSNEYIKNSTQKSRVYADIGKAYEGSSSDVGWESVKTFYEKESQNKLTINPTVSDWYECGKASTEYYAGGTDELVIEAVDWYKSSNPSQNMKFFDKNNDGYIDATILIYAFPDFQVLHNEAAENMWAFCFWLQNKTSKNYTNPNPNTYFWASFDFLYSAGDLYINSPGNGDTRFASIDTHTFIHEMGHVFGLVDYYDYTKSTNYCPAGGYTMQDRNVCGHDPFSVMALGWADPIVVKSNCEVKINPFQDAGHDLILLSASSLTSKSAFDEYLLFEFYTPTGLNAFDVQHGYDGYTGLPDAYGIRIWHVDARLVNANSGNIVTQGYSNLVLLNSNSAYAEDANSNRLSPLGSEYYDYNLLQLIRNNNASPLNTIDAISNSDLFKVNDSFSISDYSSQFAEDNRLNNGQVLNWNVQVKALSSTEATLEFSAI